MQTSTSADRVFVGRDPRTRLRARSVGPGAAAPSRCRSDRGRRAPGRREYLRSRRVLRSPTSAAARSPRRDRSRTRRAGSSAPAGARPAAPAARRARAAPRRPRSRTPGSARPARRRAPRGRRRGPARGRRCPGRGTRAPPPPRRTRGHPRWRSYASPVRPSADVVHQCDAPDRRVELISADSNALADAAARDLTAPIPSCPGWVMADLVRHVLGVHESWCRIVERGAHRTRLARALLPPRRRAGGSVPRPRPALRRRARRDRSRSTVLDLGPGAERGLRPAVPGAGGCVAPLGRRVRGRHAAPIAADGAADAIELDNALLPAAAPSAQAGFEVITTDTPFSITIERAPRPPRRRVVAGHRERSPPRPVEAAPDRDDRDDRRRRRDHAGDRRDRHRLMRTIPDLSADAAAAGPDRPWLISGDIAFTFAETEQLAAAAAAGLAEHGVRQGDIVLVVARNFPAQVFTWLGLARPRRGDAAGEPEQHRRRAGRLPRPGAPGARRVRSRPRPGRRRGGRAARARRLLSSTFTSRSRASPDAAPRPTIDPRDPVVLIPTSGTTGRSKLVTQTHQGYTLAAEGFPAGSA